MHLGQIALQGRTVAAIFEDGMARPIPEHSMLELIERCEREGVSLAQMAKELATRHAVEAQPVIPIHPVEVYGCGVAYERSATFRDGEQGTREGMYSAVYRGARPEIFFKGTGRVCVGPGEAIGLRADSRFTAPEPELALVLGCNGKIHGYTLANDVSAWDIERENPLYLPQSKTYDACCALGPVIATVDAISNPYELEIKCSIKRGGEMRFEGTVSTAKLNRTFGELLGYLQRSNHVPRGTVVLTGTGIIVTEEAALAEGDVVTIEMAEIGSLENPVKIV